MSARERRKLFATQLKYSAVVVPDGGDATYGQEADSVETDKIGSSGTTFSVLPSLGGSEAGIRLAGPDTRRRCPGIGTTSFVTIS
jgi:hypothetical protein